MSYTSEEKVKRLMNHSLELLDEDIKKSTQKQEIMVVDTKVDDNNANNNVKKDKNPMHLIHPGSVQDESNPKLASRDSKIAKAAR